MWRKDPQFPQNSPVQTSMAESETNRDSRQPPRNLAPRKAQTPPQRGRMPPRRIQKRQRMTLAGRFLQPQQPPRRAPKREERRPPSASDPRRASRRNPQNAHPPRRPAQPGNGAARDPRQRAGMRRSRPPERKPLSPFMYGTRLLILGVGIGAIAGTWLSVLDPAGRDLALQRSAANSAPVVQTQAADTSHSLAQNSWTLAQFGGTNLSGFALKSELKPLKNSLGAIAQQYANLSPGIFLIDLDTGAYVDLNGTQTYAAASTIKLPILVAFFQDVDAGKIRLEEMLVMKPEHIATGAGDLQYQPAGTQYSALDVATKMMTISDNTATNMLIERLGGAEALNQRFRSWGLKITALNNPLPDIEGTNLTSPQELAQIMAIVNRGDWVQGRSRDRILDIMGRTETAPLLKSGLGPGARLANKTGTLGVLLADMGLVDTPTGKHYAIAVMVKREFGDPAAEELIYQVSRAAYQHFSVPSATPTPILEQAPLPSPNRPEGLPVEPAEATANRR
ncbi:MAG: serine hydrolase [Desertifilum sp.]|nr:serine hydrolase [Desertifilum sp.]